MNNKLEMYRKAMEEGTILTDKVKMVYFDKELDTDVLTLDVKGIRRVIKKEDVDSEMKLKSLVRFIGRQVHYKVVEIDEEKEIIFCSRKLAQEEMAPEIIEKLKSGQEFNAVISGLIGYGAFMDIHGVYALMKNSSFSESYAAVADVHNAGDTIRVRLKKVSDNGRLEVEAVNKHVVEPSEINIDDFTKGQIVLGKVNGVKPWGAYVTIMPGLDALCDIPPTGEIEVGLEVTIAISKVIPEEKKIRGKILKVIQ